MVASTFKVLSIMKTSVSPKIFHIFENAVSVKQGYKDLCAQYDMDYALECRNVKARVRKL